MLTRKLDKRTFRTAGIVLAAVAFIAAVTGLSWLAAHWDTTISAATLTQARDNPTNLRQFLGRMPKGGDLHSHLSGAVYAERFVEWALADSQCLRQADWTIVNPPCATGTVTMQEATRDQASRDRLINALSMRGYEPNAEQTGHDRFFATFTRFGAVSSRHFADMVLDQLVAYQDQATQYAELMVSFAGSAERKPFVDALAGQATFDDKLAALEKAGLASWVETRKADLAKEIETIENKLACDVNRTRPGCKVTFRFIGQVARNNTLDDVFVQTAIAAALARIEPMVVGFNFVQPEDATIALKDYSAHMRIIAYLSTHPLDGSNASSARPVNVALHAGELWLGLVPPHELTFHIGEAVSIAGARRIGHGTSLAFERDADQLLKTMRERNIAVEVNLTSNDMVLGVRGKEHPFAAYLGANVPVVLSTDDGGVQRIDLTNEYVRAARDYKLTYTTLKRLARASLVHSFLPDADKRKELERFDAKLKEFERANARRTTILDGLLLIAGHVFPPH